MPLESLNNEQINIHDLTLEQEKKPELNSEVIYEELKSKYYNEDKKAWRDAVYKNGQFDERINFSPQMVDVFCLSSFNKEKAKDRFNELKNLHFNTQRNSWESSESDPNIYTFKELEAVLCEAQFDKQKAQKRFEMLKNPEFNLFDEETKRWRFKYGQKAFNSSDQLLSVLCENFFDHEKAGEIFKELKNSKLYDQKKQLWKHYTLKNDPDYVDENIFTSYQLLGALCENAFDRNKALDLYKNLKKTFFDQEKQQWIKPGENNYRSIDQLWGVVCEYEIKDKTETSFKSQAPPLPETRSY